MNGDGYDDIIVGVPGYSTTGAIIGYQGGPNPDTVNDFLALGPGGGAAFGEVVAGGGDYNADGFSDVAASDWSSNYWVIYLGSPTFESGVDVSGVEASGDNGYSLAWAGDVDGEGFDDLLVGVPEWKGSGSVALVYGTSDLFTTTAEQFDGVHVGQRFGSHVAAAGDVNRDGYADFLVGASSFDLGSMLDAGSADLFLGGSPPSATPALGFRGRVMDGQLGTGLAGVPDMNGDGYDDIAFSAPNESSGRVVVESVFPYVILSPNDGAPLLAGGEVLVRWRGHDRANVDLSTDGVSWFTALGGVGGDEVNEARVPVPGVITDAARILLRRALR